MNEPIGKLKISKPKILKLTDKLNLNNENFSILHIDDYLNIEDAQNSLRSFNVKNAPKLFVFVIEMKAEDLREIDKLICTIKKIFNPKRPLALQICCGNSFDFYVTKSNDIVKLNQNLAQNSLIEKIQHSEFVVESFFNVLNHLNCSLLDADLSKIAAFLGLHEIDHSLYNLAIEQRDELCFRLLNLFEVDLTQKMVWKVLKSSIRSLNFDIFLAFLGFFESLDVDLQDTKKVLCFNYDDNKKNALITSVNFRNIKVVKLLLEFSNPLMSYVDFDIWKSAWHLAIEREYFDVCIELKKIDFKESLFKTKLKCRMLKSFEQTLEEISIFHDKIKAGNFNEVKKFIQRNPKLKICKGNQKVCALECSIESKQFAIYAYLRSKGFYTNESEQLLKKTIHLSNDEKKKIRNENFKYLISDPIAFIGILLSKCSFNAGSNIHFEEVRQMLIDLSKIHEFRPVMQTVALSDVKIIFGVETKLIEMLNFFSSGILYIGKSLRKNQLYGIFAHEMTHYACFLMFKNSCLPYCEGDIKRESKWIEVVEKLKECYENDPEETENIIKSIFTNYGPGFDQNIKTTVCVNHLLAFYFDNPEKCDELRRDNPCIFDYYDDFVLPDFNVKLYSINNFNVEFLEFPNVKLIPVSLNKPYRICIRSNVPKLSLLRLHFEVQKEAENLNFFEPIIIFIDLDNYFKIKIDILRAAKFDDVKCVVIDASESWDNISFVSDYLRPDVDYYLVTSNKCKVESVERFTAFDHKYEWTGLDADSKAILLDKEILLQNTVKKLSDLLPEEKITSAVLREIVNNDKLTVNSPDSNDKIFIQRNLKRKNSNVELSLENFIDEAKNQKVVVISGSAGCGKTIILKKIELKLLQNYYNSLIFFTNFCNFKDELSVEKLPEILCKDTLKLNSSFENEIFKHFFSEKRVIILIDGLDQANTRNQKMVVSFIKTSNNCQFWLTTRENKEEYFENAFKLASYRLVPISKDDQIQFVTEFWKRNTKNDPKLIKKCAKLLISYLPRCLTSDSEKLLLLLNDSVIKYKFMLSDDFGENLIKEVEAKINHSKLLDIKSRNDELVEDDEKMEVDSGKQIESKMQKESSESLSELNIKPCLNFNEFCKIFVFLIKLNECSDDLKKARRHSKFTDDRPLWIEKYSKSSTNFFFKRKGADYLSKFQLQKTENLLKDKIKRGLRCDTLNNSLINADYSGVIRYFEDTKVDPINHAKNFGVFLAAFNAFDESKTTKRQIEEILCLKLDSKGIFLTTIESKNVKLVKILFKFVKELPHRFKFKFFKEAFNAALKIEFFDAFDEIKGSEFKFSKEKDEIIKNCELNVKEIEKLHENILTGNLDGVKKFADDFPDLGIFREKLQVSAFEKSIECKMFEVYSYLLSKGFYSDKENELHTIITKLTDINKRKIFEEYLKIVIDNPEEEQLKIQNMHSKLAAGIAGNYSNKFLDDIQKVLTHDDFKDFTIKVADREFTVHKFILSACSELFAALIKYNPEAESLELENIPVEIFECILSFVYTDELPQTQNIHEVFTAAAKLKMKGLIELTAQMLINSMENEKSLEILFQIMSAANKFEHEELKMKAFEEIKKHFLGRRDELTCNPEILRNLIEAKLMLGQVLKDLNI